MNFFKTFFFCQKILLSLVWIAFLFMFTLIHHEKKIFIFLFLKLFIQHFLFPFIYFVILLFLKEWFLHYFVTIMFTLIYFHKKIFCAWYLFSLFLSLFLYLSYLKKVNIFEIQKQEIFLCIRNFFLLIIGFYIAIYCRNSGSYINNTCS